MSTTACGTCSKIVLFIVNLVFWITGIALLGVGIWVSIDRTTVEFLLLFDDPLFKSIGFAAIAIGGLITILGFLGCFGACHESRWMLWTYFIVVLILFLAEVVSLVLMLSYQQDVEVFVGTKLDESIKDNYGQTDFIGATQAIDQLQESLECCGNDNFTNWETSMWYTSPATSDEDSRKKPKQKIPESCCKIDENDLFGRPGCQKGFDEKAEADRYEEGCYTALYMKVSENIWIIGGIFIGVAVLQVILMILTVILLRNMEEDYE